VSGEPVLYVLDRYPELSQTFVEGEIVELCASGLPVEVIALAPGRATGGRPAATADYPAAPVERLFASAVLAARHPIACARMLASERFWPPDGGRRRGLARLAPWVSTAAAARHMHAHFAAEATDIARVLSTFSGTPFSFAAHATDTFRDADALRANLAAASFCVTNCEYNRRHLAEVAPEYAGKVHVNLIGVDLERFTRRGAYSPDGPVVAVGRLVPKKGFDDLVRAAAAVQDREVLIAGEGPERARLEALIAETGARVRLLGALPNDQVRDLVEGASVFVLPCVVAPDGDRDGTPAAVLEAMALAVPVVGTHEVGLPELIGPERGRLVPPGDHRALAAAITDLLSTDPAGLADMGRAGRAWVSEHADRRRQARRVRELIERATGGRRPYQGDSDSAE
jgi:colanic acid/amylovoran biosynthesis glycosyltransferase